MSRGSLVFKESLVARYFLKRFSTIRIFPVSPIYILSPILCFHHQMFQMCLVISKQSTLEGKRYKNSLLQEWNPYCSEGSMGNTFRVHSVRVIPSDSLREIMLKGKLWSIIRSLLMYILRDGILHVPNIKCCK
jgi:hypothetical protein